MEDTEWKSAPTKAKSFPIASNQGYIYQHMDKRKSVRRSVPVQILVSPHTHHRLEHSKDKTATNILRTGLFCTRLKLTTVIGRSLG